MIPPTKRSGRISPMRLGGSKEAPIEVDVRYIGPARRREIREACSQDDPVTFTPEADPRKFAEAIAVEHVVGWRNLTPEFVGAEIGYEDYDALPVDESGHVPFSVDTMLKLWWDSERFSTAVQVHASRILKAEIEAKKKGEPSSGESSAVSA